MDHEKYAFFKDYEIGRIDSEEFRNQLRAFSKLSVKDTEIDIAWNAMLLEIPADRANWIYEATQNFNCVVLSNTNDIHINYFEPFFDKVTPYGHPQNIFQKLYYSHEIGERKPDAASFEHVLNDTGFEPSKTLLLDDLKDNLETARKLGMQTELVERNHLRKEQIPNGRE